MTDIISKFDLLRKKEEITVEEIEFARFLNELKGSDTISVLVGTACLAAHFNGHICIDIDHAMTHPIYGVFLDGITEKEIYDSLAISELIGDGSEITPLVMNEDRIYLHKFWKYEQELASWLIAKSQKTGILSDDVERHVQLLFESDEDHPDWQKVAVLISLIKDLVIISGGPGTGKTFTIQKIIDALTFTNHEGYSIALAAPTGKAAQRLSESLDLEKFEAVASPVTIHKLLGAKGESGQFQYGEKNPLPFDAIIVDEGSMLDITLWVRLIRSIPEETKLIVLGDKNQLASVEAGSILGDICFFADNSFSEQINAQVKGLSSSGKITSFNDSIVLLTKNYRFDEESGIQLLAEAINRGDAEQVIALLASEDYPEVSMAEPTNEEIESLIHTYVSKPFNLYPSSENKISLFNEYQILSALRKGPFGVETLNSRAERVIKTKYSIPNSKLWYNGRAIIVTKNSSVLKLKNGETGICIETVEGAKIQFEGREELIRVSRLQNYEPAYVTTVHKSQGSEYDHVAVMLSNTINKVLSRQLLYTSVTRARKSVLVIGNTSVISSTVQQGVVRRSGLRKKIWDK